MRLILASASPYRAQQLRVLGLSFTAIASQIDERAQPHEPIDALASRLAKEKAQAVAKQHLKDWIIGADQTLECGHVRLGKPGTHTVAVQQLQAMRGQRVHLHTAVVLLNHDLNIHEHMRVTSHITMRHYSDEEIIWYLEHDRPWDCCGSMRFEAAGPWLIDSVDSSDPTSILGLPLLVLTKMLMKHQLDALRS